MPDIPDPRHIVHGREIPSRGYCDQPYLVKADDGAWVCIMTTGSGREGESGQHVVSARSEDCGHTWSLPVPLEPEEGPEASYAVLLKSASGRIFAFYNHNTDNVRRVKADTPPYKDGFCSRVDSLGHFVFKFSDDHGCTWSARRWDIPMREMEIDRQNADAGTLKYFWNVGKAFAFKGSAYVSLHKVGGFGQGFFTRSEGVLLHSPNLLTESDPDRITWETLPEGDAGLRTPPGGGSIAEEHSYSVLSDGSFYSVFRTIDGHPACAYSRDRGRTWTVPEYQRYADGRRMKHPRAANFVWRCENGNYLYWFHNHGGRFIREHPQQRTIAYNDRNPVWLCGGMETDGPDGKIIRWSQPEIALYDDDPYIRMSYPDLIEENGRYYLTETQKETARVHEIETELIEGLWGQFGKGQVARHGCILEFSSRAPVSVPMPEITNFNVRDPRSPYGLKDQRTGFSAEVWFGLQEPSAGQTLLDNRLENGQGFALQTTERQTLELIVHDGRTENRWDCDPGLIRPGKTHHLVVIADGGPKIIAFVVDGALCDGGDYRQFGWGRFNPHLRHVHGGPHLRIGSAVRLLRLYERALRISEAIGNFRAEKA